MLQEGEDQTTLETVSAVLAEYGTRRENLIPLLQAVQERLGYLPGLAMEKLAAALDIPAVEVFGPATFYNSFRLHPPGKHQFKVCMGTACYMTGGQIALDSFERRLKIKAGETTSDRNYSLEQVACVGCCALAPVVVVDKLVEGHVTPTRVDGILLSIESNNQESATGKKQADKAPAGETPEETGKCGEQRAGE